VTPPTRTSASIAGPGAGFRSCEPAGVATTQVYEVYIKAPPQAIWDAITSPEWTKKYGYQGAVEYELRPGGACKVHSSPEMLSIGVPDVIKAEGFTRLLPAHRASRARRRADHGRHGGQQVLGGGQGWLGLDSQRHEVAHRDRELDVGSAGDREHGQDESLIIVAQRATRMRMRTKTSTKKPALLAGGNPQIAKGDGDAPVQAYIAAMPGWKRGVGRRLDALIARTVPGGRKAVKWNSPFYGVKGQGWFLSFHCFAKYIKVGFFRGTSLLPLPPGTSRQKEMRYLDIYEDDQTDEKQLASWIKQAASIPGWDGGSPRNGGIPL